VNHLRDEHLPQDVGVIKREAHKLSTDDAQGKPDIRFHSDGYVTVDGIQIAHVTDKDYIHLNPRNWIAATQRMSQSEQGALAELVFTHRPGRMGVMS
jgi:hypothetical protein